MKAFNLRLLLFILGRLGIISLIAFMLSSLANYANYLSYWRGTVRGVQTVDFNIISHTLPSKLSYLLLNKNKDDLQRTLDINYGLFGIVITDCLTSQVECPQQQIIAKTNSRYGWNEKLSNPEITRQTLKQSQFSLLRDPPETATDGRFTIPTQLNKATIIGRVYYIKGATPNFWQDYREWIKNLPGSLFSDTGAYKYYTLTSFLLLLLGFSIWCFFESILYVKRQRQAQLVEELQQAQLNYKNKLNLINQTLQETQYSLEENRQNLATEKEQKQRLYLAVQILQNQIIEKDQDILDHILAIQEIFHQEELQQSQEALAQLEHLTNNIHRLESEKITIQEELEKLDQELAVAKSQDTIAQIEIINLEQIIANNIKEKQSINERISELDSLKLGNKSLENQLNYSKELVRLFEAENQELKESITKLRAIQEDIELIKEINKLLETEKRQLEETIISYESDIIFLQHRIESLFIKRNKKDPNFLERDCKTFEELLLKVEEQYKDIILIYDTVWKEAGKLDFKPFEKTYVALEILGEIGRLYFERNGNLGAEGWENAFKEKGLVNVYRAVESEATTEQFKREHTFKHNGIEQHMTKHLTLKLGASRSVPCVQIYFYVNSETKKIDIGYLGRHLSNNTR